jgi:hypothetical protein
VNPENRRRTLPPQRQAAITGASRVRPRGPHGRSALAAHPLPTCRERRPAGVLRPSPEARAKATQSALLLVAGSAHVWELVVLQAVYGGAEAFFLPASQALLPETVAASDLQQANALIAMSANIARIGGPALAGVLIATVGAGWGLAIDAGTFLASAAFLSLMRVNAVAPAARTGTLSELRAGWRAFRSRTWLWASALEFMAANALLFSPYLVLGPEVARTSLGGAGAWAAISTASGLGAVLGGTFGLRWHPRFPLRAMFVTSLVGTSPLLVLLAAAAPLPALLVAALISGVSISSSIWCGSPSCKEDPRHGALACELLGCARLIRDQPDRPGGSRTRRDRARRPHHAIRSRCARSPRHCGRPRRSVSS